MMPSTDADRTILAGIIALRIDLVTHEALIAALGEWSVEKTRPFGEILVDSGAMSIDDRDLLETLVDRHLTRHGNGASWSLESLGDPLASRLEAGTLQVADLTHHAWPGVSETAYDKPDPYATRPFAGDVTPHSSLDHPGQFVPAAGNSTAPRFRIIRLHARGGLGQVSVAHDRELDRNVALKEIQELHADHPVSRARFVQEAEITGKLEHPGIVPIYGRGEHLDGRPYYAMRFIQGESLNDAIRAFHADLLLKRDPGLRELRLRELIGRFLDACDAVSYAHSRGILHRDLKPANVMLGPFGETLVVDWGLAKPLGKPEPSGLVTIDDDSERLDWSKVALVSTIEGLAMGSPAFMSPEQARGDVEHLGPASDIFSLGATLYSLLTGRAPYQGTDLVALIERAKQTEFPPPRTIESSIPRALEAICLKAMNREPIHRYATTQDLAADLRLWLADEPVSAWREGPIARMTRWARRNRTSVAVSGALLVATIIGLTVGLWQVGLAKHRADENAALARSRFSQALDAFHTLVYELQDQLKDRPGATAIRSELLHTAFKGIENLADHSGGDSDGSLEADHMMSSVRIQAGDLAVQLGRTDQGRKHYEQARKINERLNLVHPTDPKARRDLSAVFNRLGDLAVDGNKLDEARDLFEQAEKLVLALVARDKESIQAWRDVWVCRQKIGEIRRAQGDRAGAGSDFRRALELAAKLVQEVPDSKDARVDLASSMVNLGQLAVDSNDYKEAQGRFDAALREINGLLANRTSDSVRARQMHAMILDEIGELSMIRDDFLTALGLFDRSVAERESLYREESADARNRRALAIAYNKRGNARFLLDDVEAAAADYRLALGHDEAILAADPTNLLARRDVSIDGNRLGDASVALGDLDSARHAYTRALELREQLAAENPGSIQARTDLILTVWNLGELAVENFRPREAIPWFDRAVVAIDRLNADGLVGEGNGVRKFRDRIRNSSDFCRLIDPDKLTSRLIANSPVVIRPKMLAPRAIALARSGQPVLAAAIAEQLAKDAFGGNEVSARIGARTLALVAGMSPAGPARDRLEALAVALLRRVGTLGGFQKPTGRSWLKKAGDLDSIRDKRDFQVLRLDLDFPSNPFGG